MGKGTYVAITIPPTNAAPSSQHHTQNYLCNFFARTKGITNCNLRMIHRTSELRRLGSLSRNTSECALRQLEVTQHREKNQKNIEEHPFEGSKLHVYHTQVCT